MNNSQSAMDAQSTDGILVIDKPAGWTSHDVVARVRKLLKTRRVGHTGTLDPFATGVLIVCVNRATRLVQFLVGDDKEYLATVRLGFATDTGDLTGQPISPVSDARGITSEMVQDALAHFRGRIKQIPPMYSAKKVGGVKLYELARQGKEIERKPVEVEIKKLEVAESLDHVDRTEAPTKDFCLQVACSSGTYIRVLAEEIGARLGIGAHLVALRRMRIGCCDLACGVTLEQLAELVETGRIEQTMIPMVEAVNLDELEVDQDERRNLLHGRPVRRPGRWVSGALAKLCDHNRLLIAIAEYDAEGQIWRPRTVLSTQ